MALHEWLLPGASLLLLLVAVGLLVTLRRQLRAAGEVDADTLSATLSRTWRAEGFDRALSDVERHAEQLESLRTDIAGMLRGPQARGEFGGLFGSTADKVLRTAHVPVLVLRRELRE